MIDTLWIVNIRSIGDLPTRKNHSECLKWVADLQQSQNNLFLIYNKMACKGCKDKKPVEIENHVSFKTENGVRKYSFPKWWLVVEWKNMIEAVKKAREIMEKKAK